MQGAAVSRAIRMRIETPLNLQHWCGFQAKTAPQAAPVLVFHNTFRSSEILGQFHHLYFAPAFTANELSNVAARLMLLPAAITDGSNCFSTLYTFCAAFMLIWPSTE